MSYLHRVAPNKNTSANIEAVYNEKGQMLDANTKEVLVQGQIDKGHKHGYEEQAMRMCAERCHMTQKDYNKMMQNHKLYQFESSHNNRSHKFESTDRMQQLHNCFEVIRDYKGKNRNRIIEKYGKSDFTFDTKSKTQNISHAQSNISSDKSKSGHSSTSVYGSKTSGHGISATGSHGGSLTGGFSGGHGVSGGSGSTGGHGNSGNGGGGHGGSSSGGQGGHGGGHGR